MVTRVNLTCTVRATNKKQIKLTPYKNGLISLILSLFSANKFNWKTKSDLGSFGHACLGFSLWCTNP